MLKYVLHILFLFCSAALFAQPASSLEFGVGVGLSSYYGDINQESFFYKPKLALEGFIRYNLSSRYAVRANLLKAALEADDADFNSYQRIRGEHFSTDIIEVSGVLEFNFLPFVNPGEWGTELQTIYAMLGGGYMLEFGDIKEPVNTPVTILGIGYKRILKKRFALELEWGFRKTFSDEIDGVSDPMNLGEKSSLYNNDWYNFIGVKLSYNLWRYRGKCTTYNRSVSW